MFSSITRVSTKEIISPTNSPVIETAQAWVPVPRCDLLQFNRLFLHIKRVMLLVEETLQIRIGDGFTLILGGILATSDGKTQCVVGLPGDMIYDGGCPSSFGI